MEFTLTEESISTHNSEPGLPGEKLSRPVVVIGEQEVVHRVLDAGGPAGEVRLDVRREAVAVRCGALVVLLHAVRVRGYCRGVTDAPAGWYPDPTPATAAPTLRYWDGAAWTAHVAPGAPTTYAAAPVGPTTPDGVPLAGWGVRVGAYLIDTVLVGGVGMLVSLPAQVSAQREINALTQELESSATPDLGAFWEGYVEILRSQLVWQLPVMLLGLAYFAGMLRWKGATVGKLALGLRVRLRGREGRLPWGAICARIALLNMLGMVPFFFLVAGSWPGALLAALVMMVVVPLNLLWPLWDKQRQALHDKVARTNVVKVR